MTRQEEICQQLEKTEKEITKLTKERNELQLELAELKKSECLRVFLSWNISTKSKLILFAKNFESCYQSIITLAPTEINLDARSLKAVEGHYFLQIDPCFRCTCIHHEFSYLDKLQDAFNIFVVSDETFEEFTQVLSSLKITEDTRLKHEKLIAEVAISRIS